MNGAARYARSLLCNAQSLHQSPNAVRSHLLVPFAGVIVESEASTH